MPPPATAAPPLAERANLRSDSVRARPTPLCVAHMLLALVGLGGTGWWLLIALCRAALHP